MTDNFDPRRRLIKVLDGLAMNAKDDGADEYYRCIMDVRYRLTQKVTGVIGTKKIGA